ncbi:MAG: hypothetical protein K0R48_419 [Gammaproteobacteria bacterium]|jgi:hypothetical protein|nr:hypothetical protein [Gammaproteobacteria bacterium]
MNKKWIVAAIAVAGLLLLASIVRASDKPTPPQVVQLASPYPSLNHVHYVVQKEQWVVSDSARVIVAVNANLTDEALDQFQGKMNKSLDTLAKNASWHVTQFNRNQDSSGLEQVSAQAEARIANSALAGLRARADKLSSPGTKYSIVDIQYGPSDEDIQKAKDTLRQAVYGSIAEEIRSLNKLYKQDFFVNSVDFDLNSSIVPPPQPMLMRVAAADVSNNGNVPVNQKLVLQADVILAAKVQ